MESEAYQAIIVGAGIAGLSAAIEAHERGDRVVVLEKLPQARGNTFYSGGGSMHKISSPEKVFEVLKQTGHGKVDMDVVKAFVYRLNEAIDWIASLGLEWAPSATPVSGRPEVVQADPITTHRIKGYGAAICQTLVSAARKRGIEILFRTKAEKILTDSAGRVTGLKGTREGKPFSLEAKNVVLATGGFQGDKEMVAQYIGPWLTHAKFSGSPQNKGEGHRMAMELGAYMVNTDQWHASLRSKHRINPYMRLQYGSILVNVYGHRFIDEVGITKDAVAKTTVLQPQCRGNVIFDKGIREILSKGFAEHLVEFSIKGIPIIKETDPAAIEEAILADGTLIRASTLGELAEKLEIPPDNLESTVAEYNRAAKAGKAPELKVPRTNYAYPIITPPYYAEPVEGRFNCTLGGIKINANSQVVNVHGNPIPGLYAAGEMIGGFYYENYQMITGYLPVCLVFGLTAARNLSS